MNWWSTRPSHPASWCRSFLVQIVGYLVALAFIALNGTVLHWSALPMALLGLTALLATGLALLLSAVHVFVRDLEQGLAHALALLFYLSPILYSAAMVPGWMRDAMLLNPVAVLLEAMRAALIHGQALPGVAVAWATAFCAVVLLLGRLVFHRLSPHFALSPHFEEAL